MNQIITTDYNHGVSISPKDSKNLECIANKPLSSIDFEEHKNLLVFPNSFEVWDEDLSKKKIFSIENNKLNTNSIVGFIGCKGTQLSIHSRFANGEQDYFLHYMLMRVAKINLVNFEHSIDVDSVFDLLIYLFPKYLKQALKQGVCKQYITYKNNDANVKGTIDVSRHVRTNVPFMGNVAYNTREYSYDNNITELIRHTIEHIDSDWNKRSILCNDDETRECVGIIRGCTKRYDKNQRRAIINSNLRPIVHPYYSEYVPLQKICLQILRHEELKYGQNEDKISGVLIDAAWLWEEYLALLLEKEYTHCTKGGRTFHLFKNFQTIIPDYVSKDKGKIADAKYIPLDNSKSYDEEKATAIYYKTITYMYRFCTKIGYLFYPQQQVHEAECCEILSEIPGVNGGSIIKHGLTIPQRSNNFTDFVKEINTNESVFLNNLAH